jgi:Fe-S-cluster containining protein
MSLCDTCTKPGACCRDIPIFAPGGWGNFYPQDWPENAAAQLETKMPSHPFIPLRLEMFPAERLSPDAKGPYGMGRWSCTNLTAEGLCGDYENRPQLCRDYQAGSDRLCVMYVPPADSQQASEGSAYGT